MAKMGRPNKPTALKLVQGNPGNRRLPKHEPKPPVSAPPPPPRLNEVAAAEWRRIVDRLAALGLMTDLDVGALTAYCDAFGDWSMARQALSTIQERNKITHGFMVRTTNGNVIQAPLVGTIRSARADMVRFAAEFGMTPSARAGMDVNVGSASGDKAPKQAKAANYFDDD